MNPVRLPDGSQRFDFSRNREHNTNGTRYGFDFNKNLQVKRFTNHLKYGKSEFNTPIGFRLGKTEFNYNFPNASKISSLSARPPCVVLIFENTISPFLLITKVDGKAVSLGASQRSPYLFIIE